MQTAADYTTNAAGQFIPAGSWLDIIFNTSSPIGSRTPCRPQTHPSSQAFMLVRTSVIMPLILVYTPWAYLVFRGKVSLQEYHA